MHIGFIGLGLMGAPMTRHLLAAGHTLHLWARRSTTLEDWRNLDKVHLHASAAAVAQAAEVVFTVVADAPDVAAIYLGPDGLAQGALGKSTALTIIDMSTIAPTAARDIATRLAEQNIDFLDAPVSGGEVGAINASLTIMVGGDEAIFTRMHPLLACLGKTITYIGPHGAGQVAKACNQILAGVTTVAVAEALSLAQASGVDPTRVRTALLGGAAASHILENHGQRMLQGHFQPGFKAWMQQKDLRIALEEAQHLGLILPNTAASLAQFDQLVAAGLGEEDAIAVLKLLEQKTAQ